MGLAKHSESGYSGYNLLSLRAQSTRSSSTYSYSSSSSSSSHHTATATATAAATAAAAAEKYYEDDAKIARRRDRDSSDGRHRKAK